MPCHNFLILLICSTEFEVFEVSAMYRCLLEDPVHKRRLKLQKELALQAYSLSMEL